MASYREAGKAIGRKGTIKTREGLTVQVKILDARRVYGRDEYLVSPVSVG